MKKIAVFVLLILSIQKITVAQAKPIDPSTFAKTITEEDLKKHLAYIAGPETEGRGTGTPGIRKAAAYIENHFKKLGLQQFAFHQYQMEYTLLQDSITESYIKVNGKQFNYNDYFSGSNRNNIVQNLNANEIVYVGYGIDDVNMNDYNGIDVNGKIVLVEEGEPKTDTIYTLTGSTKRSDWSNPNFDKKQAAAIKNGAIAMFIISKNYKKAAVWPQPKGRQYPQFTLKPGGINRYFINTDLATELTGTTTLQKGTSVKKEIEISFNKIQIATPSTNVIGVLPGTDKADEYVLITAHMDHLGMRDGVIYYGADDDGSGTCGVMEIAEAFAKAKKAGNGPRRSMVFMTVSGEEMGLWGSKYYVDNPVFPLEKTTVDLNIDMIGRVGSDYIKDAPDSLNYVYVIGDDKLSTDLRPINEAANKMVNLKLDYRYNDPNDKNRFYYRSDHYNFAEKGVPIIFYFDGVHKDYHKATDTPEKINYELYAKRTQLVFHTAWLMANKEEMLKRDIPLK
jgi:general stress protein 26